jgi:predicted RNA binding protein YcfA (HicA-like mRNA interferase family)
VRFFKAQGFVEDRQSGSHLTLWHADRQISVTIPLHSTPTAIWDGASRCVS